MKNFADGLKLFCVISGAVMGAGFLSGGELVAFFRGRDVFCLSVSGAVFFVGFAFIRAEQVGFIKTALFIADLIFSAAMLSGLDDISVFIGVKSGIPAASVLSLVAFHFLFSKDINKVEKLNAVLIPVSVIIVLCAVIFSPAPAPTPAMGNFALNAVNALLYACMNVFVALPSVNIAKKHKTKTVNIAASACFAVFFAVFAYLILRASDNSFLPLIELVYGTIFYPFIIVAIFIGSFTSLVCYLYPLKTVIFEKGNNKKMQTVFCVLLYLLLFLLSRLGFGVLIKYFYPVIGAMGLTAITKSVFGIKKVGIGDTMKKRSALCQERKRPKSKNLPKKNTAII